MIRKISAHYIYTVNSTPLKNGIIIIDDSGRILDVIDTGGELQESERLEFFDGIITPGFVNAHTHIELSHLKNKITQKTGITGFITEIEKIRHQQDSLSYIYKAELELKSNGIVAYGDIVNTSDSIEIKKKSPLLNHSFVEIFSSNPAYANTAFEKGVKLLNLFREANLNCSLVPHAPYSISNELWRNINNYSQAKPLIWSIHNQESNDENLLFISKTGKFKDQLEKFNPEFAKWKPSGKSSLQTILPNLIDADSLLLVHNTYTNQDDLEALLPFSKKIHLVLCPKSNLYIENSLPDVPLFEKYGFNIAIGTDSLASNNSLSVLEELLVLQERFCITFEKLLNWATINGAKALQLEHQIGSIEKGKRPGLNLITHFNYSQRKLTHKSFVKVIA